MVVDRGWARPLRKTRQQIGDKEARIDSDLAQLAKNLRLHLLFRGIRLNREIL